MDKLFGPWVKLKILADIFFSKEGGLSLLAAFYFASVWLLVKWWAVLDSNQ